MVAKTGSLRDFSSNESGCCFRVANFYSEESVFEERVDDGDN